MATAIRTVIILLIAWGIVLATGEAGGLSVLSRKTVSFLVLSGAATGISWLFYFKALQMSRASFVTPLDKSSLVMILGLSILFLGEPFSWWVGLGRLLITLGTVIFIL